MDPRDRIVELLERVEDLPKGAAQIAVVEEAVALADSSRDREAQFYARKELTKAAVFGGRPDLAMVSFAWTLAASDDDPEAFPDDELLWQYKWLTENLPYFSTIPRGQIEELLADMEARYARHGSTLHAVVQIRRDVAAQMGDLAGAEALDARFRKLKRDPWSNCAACVLDSTVEYHLLRGDDAAALKDAQPALAGRVVCGEVPHRTHAIVLLAYLRAGQVDKAAASHKAGYKLVKGNPKFVPHQAHHVAFLALTGNFGLAARAFGRHLPDALTTPCQAWKFDFLASGRLLADRVAAANVSPDIKLPDGVPADWPALRAWLDHEARALADGFNARNGNDHYTGRLKFWHQQAKHATTRQV